MSGTQISFVRRAITVDGVNQFEITATCLIAGSLPDRHIFVLEITEEDDPKNDALQRVAAIQDFSTYLADRDDALDEGFAAWRSSTVTLRYSNLTTANAAASELSSRINALVEDQDLNELEFITGSGGELVTYPVVDPSEKQALIDAAEAAEEAISPLETTRDEKRECTESLQTEIDVLEERIQEAQTDLTSVNTVLAELSPISTSLSSVYGTSLTAVAQVRTLNSSSSASTSEKADIESQLVNLDSYLITWNTQNTNLSTVISSSLAAVQSTLQTRITTLSTQRNAKITELAKCNQELAIAQGAVDAARDSRDAALAAVLEVCPDFTL